ncbi:MAG: hypothetical protein R3C43_03845 [Chloroflexota bacterium]
MTRRPTPDRRFREVPRQTGFTEDSHVAALVTHAYEDVYRLDRPAREIRDG